jgi:ABC-type cobalt transport system substrate-binding protein
MSRHMIVGLVLIGFTMLIAFLKIVFRDAGETSGSDSVSESVLNRIRVEYRSETR